VIFIVDLNHDLNQWFKSLDSNRINPGCSSICVAQDGTQTPQWSHLVSLQIAHSAHKVRWHHSTSAQILLSGCSCHRLDAVRQTNLRSALSENRTQPKIAFYAQNQMETDQPQKTWNCNNIKWFITSVVCSSQRTAQLCWDHCYFSLNKAQKAVGYF